MNINDVAKALKKNRYEVSVFESKEMATEYLTCLLYTSPSPRDTR